MRKHYREIDILKGLAIAMVMLGHSIIVYPININLIPWCGNLHLFVNSAHMSLFFMISGFCFGFSNWKDYALKKFKRIVVPMIVFGILGAIVQTLGGSLVKDGKNFLSALLGVLTGDSLWFLHALLIYFIIFPFIRKLFESKLWGAVFILATIAFNLFVKLPSTFNLDNIGKYLLYFSTGYYLKLRFRENPEFFKKLFKRIGTLPVWIISLGAWVALFLLLPKYNVRPLRVVCEIITAFAGILTVTAFAILIRRFCFSKLFEEAGKYSLQIFLFNGYFLTLTRTLVVSKLHITSPVVIIAANFFMMFFVSLLLIKFVVAKVKLFRTLTGLV